MRLVISFFNIQNVSAAEIQRQIFEVYNEQISSDFVMRRSIRQFIEGWIRLFREGRSGQQSFHPW